MTKGTIDSINLWQTEKAGSKVCRAYMPGLARYLSQVRLAEQLGNINPYIYSLNNPTTYTAYTVRLGFERPISFASSSVQPPIEELPTPGICQNKGKQPPQKPKPKRKCQNGKLTNCTLITAQSASFCDSNANNTPGKFNDCQGCKKVAGCKNITDNSYTFVVYIKSYHCTYQCKFVGQECDCY